MAMSVLASLMPLPRAGEFGMLANVVGMGIELAMCIALVRGSILARFAVVLLMGGAGLFALATVAWPVGVVYLGCVGVLLSRASRFYFRDPSLAAVR